MLSLLILMVNLTDFRDHEGIARYRVSHVRLISTCVLRKTPP